MCRFDRRVEEARPPCERGLKEAKREVSELKEALPRAIPYGFEGYEGLRTERASQGPEPPLTVLSPKYRYSLLYRGFSSVSAFSPWVLASRV